MMPEYRVFQEETHKINVKVKQVTVCFTEGVNFKVIPKLAKRPNSK